MADLDIDLKTRTVRRGTQILDVHDLTFDMLAILVTRAPDAVSREDFAESVWRVTYLSEETLTQRAAMLRRALGDSAKSPRYIRTVRGIGYAIACEVQKRSAIVSRLLRHEPRTKAMSVLAGCSAAALLAGSYFMSPMLPAHNPDDVVANTTVASLQLARARDLLALHQPFETNQAISLLEAAKRETPQSRPLRLTLSFAYSTRATKFEAEPTDIPEAERLARELISEDVSFGRAWHALAYALDAQGRVDEAISSYQHAYSLDPSDVAAMSSAAYLLQIRGRLSDAIDLETRALQAGQPTLYAPIQIAVTLSFLDHPASNKWWERALASGSHQSVILTESAREDLRNNDPVRALDRLSSAPVILNNTPRALRLLGRAHLQLGDHEAARRAFEEAGYEARFEQAALAYSYGEQTSATALIEATEATMIEGDSWPEVRVRLAEVYAASGDHDTALALLSRAVDLGWRDIREIYASPFFSALAESGALKAVDQRINRELNAQKQLLLAHSGTPIFDIINAPL